MNAAVTLPQRDRGWIGGGNVAGILGLSPYKTPLDEYLTIVGEGEPTTPEREAFFARRKAFEPLALNFFSRETGRTIANANVRYTDAEHMFIRAELDGETDRDENVEIKTVHPFAAADWGHADTDEIPVYVTAQCMHGLMVRQRQVCYPVALIGFDDWRVYRIERDDETIAAIRPRLVQFWRTHIEQQLAPDPTSVGDLRLLYPRDSGRVIEADPEALADFERMKQLSPMVKEIDEIKDRLRLYMRDATTLEFGGKALATWKAQTSRRFDQSAFAGAHAELFEQFKTTIETRVLRIK